MAGGIYFYQRSGVWDFVPIFSMSLIGAVVIAIFVLLMGASAACVQDLPVVAEPAEAHVDLAIKDDVLVDMGSFHRLSMTVENIGSDSRSYAFDIGMVVKVRTLANGLQAGAYFYRLRIGEFA